MGRSIVFFVLLFFGIGTQAQVRGIIEDRDSGEPIGFATVALISAKDSTVIEATTSDNSGAFRLSGSPEQSMLKVTFLGYEPCFVDNLSSSTDNIVKLHSTATSLAEVVVQAKLFHPSANGIVANVAGSTLSKLGTAADVLKHMPLISSKSGDYEIMGKGTTLIYINNRQVRDNSELQEINSDDVRQVKIITNPGAEYAATVGAVIRIYTKKPVGEGLSLLTDAYMSAEREVGHGESVNLNYRRKGWDVFSSFRLDRDNTTYNQTDNLSYDKIEWGDRIIIAAHSTTMSGTIGTNYQWKDKLYTGIRYKYTGTPNFKDMTKNLLNTSYEGKSLTYNISDNRNNDEYSHYVNAYSEYTSSEKSSIKLDMDYYYGKAVTTQLYTDDSGQVGTDNNSINKLIAGRLTYRHAVDIGSINAGVEGSYTDNNNRYVVDDGATINTALRTTNNRARQSLGSVFVQYEQPFGEKWNASAGLRYEYTRFDYRIDGTRQNESSKCYSGLYPSASLSYQTGGLLASLSYRYLTSRPDYFALRSSVSMNNQYEYEGGNPTLQPMKDNKLSLNVSYKDMGLVADLDIISNGSAYVTDIYNGSDSVTFFHPINLSTYRRLAMLWYYSPTLWKVWNPQMQVAMYKNYIHYNSNTCNRALFTFELDNTVTLPHSLILGCDMSYNTRGGNYNNTLSELSSDFNMDVYAVKSFLKDRLRLNVKLSNILNTSREKWIMNTNGITLGKWSDAGKRTFLLTLSYRLNPTKDKYRGKASTNELNRF